MKRFMQFLALVAFVGTAHAGLTNPSGVKDVVTQSIEINGVSYAPGSTVTLDSPNVTFRVTIANDMLVKAGTAGHIAYYASLCADTASCVLDGTSKFPAWNETTATQTNDLAQTTVTSGTYSVFYSDDAKSFFSYPAHPLQINAKSLGLTFAINTPAAFGLKSGANAVASAGLSANVGIQALSATVTPRSGDVGATGQFYVAALLADGSLYFKTPSGWVAWQSGTIPVFSSVTLAAGNAIEIGSYDLAGLVGASIYVGYGKGAGAAAEADLSIGKFAGWPIK